MAFSSVNGMSEFHVASIYAHTVELISHEDKGLTILFVNQLTLLGQTKTRKPATSTTSTTSTQTVHKKIFKRPENTRELTYPSRNQLIALVGFD